MSSNDLSKIQRDHLQRLAYVYVRQSSLHQVQFNTASAARQYNLVERAKELGWPDEKIIMVDQDQGQSGASLEGRDGFKIMMRDILMGNVGAVFSLEASRLARDSSDWHLLVKLCITRNTLIIDEQGIHNPRVFNDRLLLSIKGTLSDAELHLIASRLHGGRLQRAKEGKLRFPLPAGYVYDTNGCIVFDPSPEVQETVRLLFDKFDELGSCLATVRYFRSHNLLLPNRRYDGGYHAEHRLSQMTHGWARSMLHNPIYAGIYVYGQTRADIQVISRETMETTSRRVHVPPEDWAVVIRENHEGYITEDRYRRNLQRLKDNRTRGGSPGAINRGQALLQGLVRCGVCGRSMQVKYPGGNRRHVYYCQGARETGEGICQYLGATKVDATITEVVLKAFEPAQLELAEANFKHLEAEGTAIRDQWKLQLREAEKEADSAAQLFKKVAIQNRHVAGQLQDEWEQALQRVEQIRQAERDLPSPPSPETLASTVRRLSTAAQNLQVVWHAISTDDKDRKQLIRLLIKDVILLRKLDLIHMTIRWISGGRLEIEIPYPTFRQSHESDAEVIEMLQEMASTHPDRVIADRLNALGYRRRWGQEKFTPRSISTLRRYRDIPRCPDHYPADRSGPRGDGRYNTRDVARLVGRCQEYIGQLCKEGKLDAIRSGPKSPWWIRIDSPQFEQLRDGTHKRDSNDDFGCESKNSGSTR
jgi:DNA invertase Pin-like site-specific DNA recombinase